MKPLKVKDTIFGEGIPKICIPITGNTEGEIYEAAGRIAVLPHDVVEWRADYYKEVTDPARVVSVLTELRKLFPKSLLLFTFRTHREGGVKELSEGEYLEVCRSVAADGLSDLLDIELFTGEGIAPVIELAHKSGTAVILSSHDFQKTPPMEELLARLSAMEAAGADIAKLAVMPNSTADVITLMDATRQADETLRCPIITMSMGKMGVVSRISGALTGSCLTFGTAGAASAPGQIDAVKLKEILELL